MQLVMSLLQQLHENSSGRQAGCSIQCSTESGASPAVAETHGQAGCTPNLTIDNLSGGKGPSCGADDENSRGEYQARALFAGDIVEPTNDGWRENAGKDGNPVDGNDTGRRGHSA